VKSVREVVAEYNHVTTLLRLLYVRGNGRDRKL